jgi:hypothetical protein
MSSNAPEDPLLSTDSEHSTYASVDPLPDNPPAGARVEETRGYPVESGGAGAQSAKRSTSKAS